MTSVADAITRMQAIEAALPATDGVSCFNRMYLEVTVDVEQRIAAGFFADAAFMAHFDVVFANQYFAAVDASSGPLDQVPVAWQPLIERRAHPGIFDIQYALAGMNAHINHDLPITVVRTCTDLATSPFEPSCHADYQKVDALLDAAEQSVRQSFESGEVRAADHRTEVVLDLIGDWSITSARDAAWDTALALWQCRDIATVEDLMMGAIGRTVAAAARCLLVAV